NAKMSSTNDPDKPKSSILKSPTRCGFLSVEVVEPRSLLDGIYISFCVGDNDNFCLDTQELKESLES
ncbi:7248_t:CDS:2, partial [Entrophospora sp. SA101]